jgi:hypothetical protein
MATPAREIPARSFLLTQEELRKDPEEVFDLVGKLGEG